MAIMLILGGRQAFGDSGGLQLRRDGETRRLGVRYSVKAWSAGDGGVKAHENTIEHLSTPTTELVIS